MTTITNPDISHKKPVATRFHPNTYRVISEDVPEHESIPHWYGHARPPPLYTHPDPEQLPAQASEPRNNPHAARKVDMVYTNASTFNAPVGMVRTDNVQKEESRWWDWSPPKAEPYGPGANTQEDWKKINESSYRNAFHASGEAGPYGKRNTRYSASPFHVRTVGIVPVTDLKPDYLETVPQTLAERVSFEQQYNSRSANNYPLRGRRHGAFVIEEAKVPGEQPDRTISTTSTKLERGASMWDLFHPEEKFRGQQPNNPYKYRRPLPEIPRSANADHVWQSAPYATEHQYDPSISKPPLYKQINIE